MRFIRNKQSVSNERKKGGRERGFALIACLTLMMLLGLLAVGILAVASSQNRIASQILLVSQARNQALIGLDAAISELQLHAGADQRVTASSGILNESAGHAKHILGVWNSWTAPLYGQVDGRSISSTYSEGRSNMFRSWLISCTEPSSLRQLSSINNLGSRRQGSRVLLVGEGTMGRGADRSDYVYADLISMPGFGSNETCYAWWVGGENQKANITFRDRERTNDPVEALHRTWDTPAPIFDSRSKLRFLDGNESISDPEKVLSLKTLPLVSHSSHEGGIPYFFDATTYSFSLPVNVRDGGLKYDLNLLLNKKTLVGTPFAPRADQDAPIAEGQAVPVGVEPSMPIGSWQTMHAYHNTWPDGSGSDDGFSGRLVGSVTKAHSRIAGNLVEKSTSRGDRITVYDTRSIDNHVQAGYARAPLLVSFMGAWGLMLTEPQAGFSGYSHTIAYAPFTMWWNPYNVQIRVGAKKLWMMSLPYRTTSIFIKTGGTIRRWSMVQALRKTVDGNGSIGQRNVFGNDWGNYLVNSEQDQTGDIVFEPGEILVFSMSKGVNSVALHNQNGGSDSESNTPNIQPQQIPFVLGDNVGELHNYAVSLYSYGRQFQNLNSLMFETQGVYDNANVVTTIDPDDGSYSHSKYRFDTVGDVFGPGEREIFVVPYGYDGLDSSSERGKNLTQSRETSKPDRFVGARGMSPNNFSLGWYDYQNTPIDDLTFITDAAWSDNMGMNEPSYYMAVGIAPKSFNPSYNSGLPMFRNKDYRTKVWLHSNPALGSSALYRPDEQQRQYNPFQLAAVEMGVGFDRGVLDTPNNRNGVWGLSSAGSGGGESVSFIATHEVPMHPPFSLAGFAGMRLSPGWYKTGDDNLSLAAMRRVQYQAGVPGVGIGNSFADPCLPANDVHVIHANNISTNLPSNGSIFTDFFDHALIINDALWDQWFCSSISDMPTKSGKRQAREVVTAFVNGQEPLPVSRYKRAPMAMNSGEIINRIMADNGWMHVARYLLIEGGFNVNSVSVDAWTAMLQGLAKRELVTNAGGTLELVQKDEGDVLFSRFMVSTTNMSIDRTGYSVLQGSGGLRPGLKMASTWGEIRQLDPTAIRRLAEEIVKKVRERGPFLNMSDFINRRLDGGSNTALTGALQAAIDATDINREFTDSAYNVTPASTGSLYSYPQAEAGSMYTAAPGYLIQSDVLASLGNILTVRDDTFVVRAYGCVRNGGRAILAQAWCEAVVQRTMEYVDPSDTPDTNPGSNTRRDVDDSPEGLSEINKVMGRRFRVVSFKWIDAWDL